MRGSIARKLLSLQRVRETEHALLLIEAIGLEDG